jgi:tRNA threonylcarbamoyladenosine biosynthesis protein TsaB
MNVLSVETSGTHWGIAAVECADGSAGVRAVAISPEPRQLSQRIMLAIDEVLTEAAWSLEDVDVLAVGLGPGSWTGLRIGLTTCKTLAQARGWQLCGVPTLDAFAQAVWRATDEDDTEARLLLATIPCRPGEVYGKLFECSPEYLAVVQSEWIGSPEMMVATAGAEALSHDIHTPLLLTGDAAGVAAALLDERSEAYDEVAVAPEAVVVEIALAGAAAAESGELTDPMELQPLYLAPSAAERNLQKLAARGG